LADKGVWVAPFGEEAPRRKKKKQEEKRKGDKGILETRLALGLERNESR
jgi:hypothetical protein